MNWRRPFDEHSIWWRVAADFLQRVREHSQQQRLFADDHQ